MEKKISETNIPSNVDVHPGGGGSLMSRTFEGQPEIDIRLPMGALGLVLGLAANAPLQNSAEGDLFREIRMAVSDQTKEQIDRINNKVSNAAAKKSPQKKAKAKAKPKSKAKRSKK